MIDLDLWPTFSGYLFGKHVPSPRHPPHLYLLAFFALPVVSPLVKARERLTRPRSHLAGGREMGGRGNCLLNRMLQQLIIDYTRRSFAFLFIESTFVVRGERAWTRENDLSHGQRRNLSPRPSRGVEPVSLATLSPLFARQPSEE